MGQSGLKMRQLRFCAEYVLNGGNGTQAALAAGYSSNTAAEMAYENLKKPQIQKEVARLQRDEQQKLAHRAEKRGITRERWLQEIERIAFVNIDDLIKIESKKIKQGKKGDHFTVETARAIATVDRDKDLGRAIKKIVPGKDGSVGIELHDKKAALESYGKAMGWIKEESILNLPQVDNVTVNLTMPANGREAKPEKKS
jgi:phage terminase small subunit